MIAKYWWVATPFLLFFASLDAWLLYVRKRYLLSLKWTLLEIKPPPDVQKSPKIAENIFSGLHAVYTSSVKTREQFWQGKVQPWFSFEIVGNGGEIGFFIRTPEGLRSLVEAQIFAQYPDAEIKIVDDYVSQVPEFLPDENYDMFGTELVFSKPDAYPIKTYPFFEEDSGKDEFKRTDPLSPLAEIMSTLESGEHIWIQLLIRATNDYWVKEAKVEIDKMLGKEAKKEPDFLDISVGLLDKVISGGSSAPEEKKKDENPLSKMTPGQKFVLEQVENKISKLGFKSGYRFIYLARKDCFHGSHISAVMGMFKQLYFNNLNSFRPNGRTITSDKGVFSWFFPSSKGFFYKQREFRRKWNLYQNYRNRSFVDQYIILNTEELATLFHLPGIGVKAPSFPRVEAKKSQPPSGLPTG